MANSMADAVRGALKLALRTAPGTPIAFAESDFTYNKLASKIAALEAVHLVSNATANAELTRFAALHLSVAGLGPAAASLRAAAAAVSAATPVASAATGASAAAAAPKATAKAASSARPVPSPTLPPALAAPKPPAPSTEFPLLTLASVPDAERKRLNAANIHSGLDLVGMSAGELAARLGTDEASARALRLQVLGAAPAPTGGALPARGTRR
jgi:hypothetical protein